MRPFAFSQANIHKAILTLQKLPECHRAGTVWARRFLTNLEDNFMEQILREPAGKGALLVKRVGLAMVSTEPPRLKSLYSRKSARKSSALDMRRANLWLLMESVRPPWKMLCVNNLKCIISHCSGESSNFKMTQGKAICNHKEAFPFCGLPRKPFKGRHFARFFYKLCPASIQMDN